MSNKIYTFVEARNDTQMQLFGDACCLLGADGISIFTNKDTMDTTDEPFQWIHDALGDALWDKTWIAVLPCPSFAQFMLDITMIDRQLLTTGLAGAPAHKTSLFKRVLIPMEAINNLPAWGKGEGQIPTVPDVLLEDLPPTPVSQLGLPRHKTAKKAVPVAKPASQDIDLDALDLTTDEKAFAEEMLSGIGLQAAANKVGMSWQAVVQKLKPAIVQKFKAAGKDFEAACDRAKKQGGLTPV